MPAEIPDGAFIVARAIFNSSVWTMRKDDRLLAVTLIGLANWKDRKWFDGKAERVIKRGQLVRSVRKLAKEAGLSYKECRTSLQHLENVGFLAQDSTSHYTIITLPKYDKYQDLTRYSDLEWSPELAQYRAQPGRTPGDKQEGDIGNERKEGGEGASFSPASGSVAANLASIFRTCVRKPLSQERAIAHVSAALELGVDAQAIEAAFMLPANKGKNIWAILDPLRASVESASAPSERDKVIEIMKRWGVKSNGA